MHKLIFVSLLAVSGLVHASETPCAAAYHKAYTEHAMKVDGLSEMESDLTFGTGAGLAAAASCLYMSKSILGCGALVGPVVGITGYYREEVAGEIQQSNDAFKIYTAYVNADGSVPVELAARIRERVDSGQLCNDNQPSGSWEELTTSLR